MTTPPHAIARRIRTEAETLAGRPEDLIQRAAVYLHLYRHSGGRHAFPLLAAHGALWGAGFFRMGLRVGRVLAAAQREGSAKLARLNDFATAFKDINRRVCIETYSAYHITGRLGVSGAQEVGIDPDLASALGSCHAARRSGQHFDDNEKQALFQAFFRWEQDNVVQSAIDAALSQLDWPLMEAITMRPVIRFRYFNSPLLFRNFAQKDERISQGNAAYARAVARGWDNVEADISRYGTMPRLYCRAPDAHYTNVLSQLRLTPLTAVA